jgi:REP element-mobilizing transposase RayT
MAEICLLESERLFGQSILSKHCNAIETHLHKAAKRRGIRILRFANVGNHLHLLIKVPSRPAWQRFSKELSGGIARIVTGARKGVALDRKVSSSRPGSAQRAFWDHLLFTRIVSFGRDYQGVARFINPDGIISGVPS